MTDTAAAGNDAPPRRRRPKNRKAQILSAAAEAFSERGYHAVGVDDIAAVVGISGPALYRHFPAKYALFTHAVMRLADTLMAATDPALTTESDPESTLDAVVLAIIRTTIDNRRTGGLYRWEGRYLIGDDKIALRDAVFELGERVRRPLHRLRPELSETDTAMLSTAAISVIASITAHRSALSAKQIEALMSSAAWSILRADLPPDSPTTAVTEAPRRAPVSKREVLLHQAIALFYARGYHEVSIEEIGAAAGINASSVYRHFPSKAELLAAAFQRANERLTVALGDALAESESSVQAIEALARLYTELSFERSELLAVYFAEIGNVPADQRTTLRNVQRLNVEEWAHLVREARPELTGVGARFLVHAALGLVFDVGRVVRFDRSPSTIRRVQHLMTTVLLG